MHVHLHDIEIKYHFAIFNVYKLVGSVRNMELSPKPKHLYRYMRHLHDSERVLNFFYKVSKHVLKTICQGFNKRLKY